MCLIWIVSTISIISIMSSLVTMKKCQEDLQFSSNFFEESKTMCDLSERLAQECSTAVPASSTLRSPVECLTLCESDKSCIGASLDEDRKCFHHRECPTIPVGCAVKNKDHRYYRKYCAHGFWDAKTERCKCVDGFFGDRCNECFRSCKDLLHQNLTQVTLGSNRVYLDPDHNGSKPFLAMCHVDNEGGFVTFEAFKNNGERDFDKTWLEYENGFQYDTDSFWTGLHAWNRMSEFGCNKLVLLFANTNQYPGSNVYRVYDNFVLSDEADQYRISFGDTHNGEYSHPGSDVPPGEFGDCLKPLKGRPFSTRDMAADENDFENCAANAGSGWWFSASCDNPCNALGVRTHYWSAWMPQQRQMSLLGVDMAQIPTDAGHFVGYLDAC